MPSPRVCPSFIAEALRGPQMGSAALRRCGARSVRYRPFNVAMSRIREVRERQGLSLRQLADAAGVSPGTVHNMEHELHRPNRLTRRAVAEVLGVPEPALFPDLPPRGVRREPVVAA